MAAKVAGGVVLCTVLWDASFWLGNVFAVPGITDNLVCGEKRHQALNTDQSALGV